MGAKRVLCGEDKEGKGGGASFAIPLPALPKKFPVLGSVLIMLWGVCGSDFVVDALGFWNARKCCEMKG